MFNKVEMVDVSGNCFVWRVAVIEVCAGDIQKWNVNFLQKVQFINICNLFIVNSIYIIELFTILLRPKFIIYFYSDD